MFGRCERFLYDVFKNHTPKCVVTNSYLLLGVFHLYSVGPNLVVIRSIMTGLFLSLEHSTLTTKVSNVFLTQKLNLPALLRDAQYFAYFMLPIFFQEFFDESCIFQEDLSESYYVYYTSWNDSEETPVALCLESNGKLSVKRFVSFSNFCSLRGILFKTVMLPKSQFTHFFTIARSLDA